MLQVVPKPFYQAPAKSSHGSDRLSSLISNPNSPAVTGTRRSRSSPVSFCAQSSHECAGGAGGHSLSACHLQARHAVPFAKVLPAVQSSLVERSTFTKSV